MPRRYTGCDGIDVDEQSLAEILRVLADTFPDLAGHCFDGKSVKPGFLVGINSRFDNAEPVRVLRVGDTVQFLSADVGGH